MIMSLALYSAIALCGAIAVFLGTDEAAKYIEPEKLFWARGLNGVLLATATTLKGYTSEAFANWKAGRTTQQQQQPTNEKDKTP
jgi:hypothetical protein